MKNQTFTRVKKSMACALLAAVGFAGIAHAEEPQHPVKPLLWKIQGEGLEKPSYLFATIHLGGGPLDNLHPAAEAAFDAADVVYTEVPMDPGTQLAMVAGMIRKDGKTLTESIGPGLAEKFDEELKQINPALDATPFNQLKTWTAAMALPMLPAQLQGDTPIDIMLWQKAVAAKKQTAGIEKPEDQSGIFDDLTEDEQIILMEEMIRILREDRAEGRDSIRDLRTAYVSGDIAAVQVEMEKALQDLAVGEHKEFGERLMKRLIDDRDANMAGTIHRFLQESPGKVHFFAAGAGHFASKTSILAHLGEKGYQITAITE